MNFDRYTTKAQEAVARGQTLALEYGHSQIEPVHLAVALTEQKDGVVPEVIAKIGARPAVVLSDLMAMLENKPRVSGSNAQPTISRLLLEIFNRAEKQASQMKEE